MKGRFLFLGTGASAGIPMIGCHCPVCSSLDPHNKRTRPSGVLELGKIKILIDAGPDLRFQALKFNLDNLDGVMLTHAHFDHTAGIDELRSYYIMHGKILPVLLSHATFEDLKKRFSYLFQEKSWGKSLAAQLKFQVLENERGTVEFLGISIRYMTYIQGGMKVLGYRIGDFAYISDIKEYPETIFEDLKGVKHLVLSALRHEPSHMHFTVEEAISFVKKVQPEKTYFTHVAHDLDHETTNRALPKNMKLAHDGLKVEFSYGK